MVCMRVAVAAVLTVWLLLCLSSSPAEALVPILSPLSLVAPLDPQTSHRFHCVANGSGRPDVEIDDQFFNHQDIVARGIDVILDSHGNTHNSTITIPATIENNATCIQCLLYTDSGREDSFIGEFYVQGLLEAPATEIVAVNASHLQFSWTPPFSLDLPASDPDILSYSFHETLTPSSEDVSEVQQFVFPVLATPVEFSVSAWNIVGEGATATATHQPCSLSEERQTVSAASVRREVVYQEDGGVSLSLSLPWLTDCFPLFSLELAERGGGGGGTVLHDRLVPRVTGTGAEREVQLTVPLQGRDNTHYTAQLSSTSSERTLAAQERLNYSTHDVQLVEINFTPTSITTSCLFAVGSLALGCSVHITQRDDTTPVKTLSLMRESGANEQGLPLSAEATADGLESGVYTVTVYDIESDGEIRTDETPAHTVTVDITEPTTKPPPSTPSSTEPSTDSTSPVVVTDPLSREQNSQSNNAVPIIAGAIVAGVLLISLVLLIVVSVTVLRTRIKRQRKAEEAESREREFVLIPAGATISSESMANAYLSPAHTLQVSSSSSPSHTLPGSASSLQRNSLTKESLPPAYSEVEKTKYLHTRSMSDVVVTNSNTRSGGESGGVVSQEGPLLAESGTAANPSPPPRTVPQKKAVEGTLSAPPTSPPPSFSQTASSSVAPQITSHTHLPMHERSSSLGGPYPSHPPPHPPKKSGPKRHRAPPAPSFSTPALLPPHLLSSPLSLPTSSSLTPEDTPTGREILSLREEGNAAGSNPLYDTTVALQLKAEEKKRRSIQYAEVVPRNQTVATPTGPAPLLPHDKEVVLYSQLNVEELVPRLPTKRTQTAPASQLQEITHRAH